MDKLFRIKDSLQLLYESVTPICKNVFVGNRKKSLREKTDEFIIVSLPVRIHNQTIGNCGMTRTTCRIEIYVRDRDGEENVNRIDELTSDAISLFPISRNGICASMPSVVMTGSDGNGFHVITIHAELSTN